VKVYVNREAFELVEKRKEKGITAKELSEALGITKRSAATWLSKWYTRGYLKYNRDRGTRGAGTYYIDNTCIWWGSKVFETERGFL